MFIKKIAWVLYALSLVACSLSTPPLSTPTPKITPTKSPIVQKVPTAISSTKSIAGIINFEKLTSLSSDNCEATCFLDITPGKTPLDSVESILDDHLDHSCSTLPDNITLYRLICFLPEYSSSILISFNPSTGIVDWLGYSPDQPIYLEDIVELYGNPDNMSAVILPDERDDYLVNLYYDSLQMIIALEDTHEVTEVSQVGVIVFMVEKSYLDEKSSDLYPWEGYGMYP